MALDDVVEDLGGRFVLVQGARDSLDGAGRDVVALADELRKLAHDSGARFHGVLVTLEREHVAAQKHVGIEMALERPQHGILASGQFGRHRVVKLDRATHYRWAAPRTTNQAPRASRTRAEVRLPSARPPDAAITAFITWPMSLGLDAPVSEIAEAII